MNYSDPSFSPARPARIRAVFEIIMVSGIVSSLLVSLVFAAIFGRSRLKLLEMDAEFFVTYALSESVVTFLILWMLVKLRGETFHSLGLRWERWKRFFLVGILAAPCLFIAGGVVNAFFHLFLSKYALDKNPLMEMIHSPRQLALFIIAVIVGGGIKEELQRAFILVRFRHSLGGASVGLIVWSLVFGAGHYAQGAQGVCTAAILGFIFGILYLTSKTLILPITAHSAYNAMALLGYWFFIGANK